MTSVRFDRWNNADVLDHMIKLRGSWTYIIRERMTGKRKRAWFGGHVHFWHSRGRHRGFIEAGG